jgi:hypothetical protein
MFDVINNAIDPNRGDVQKNPSDVLQQNLYTVMVYESHPMHNFMDIITNTSFKLSFTISSL